MAKVKYETETIDGKERIWFPCLLYRNRETGETTKYPPIYDGTKDVFWSYVIIDVAEWQILSASGMLNDPRHTGRERKQVIDHRKALH